jgi:G3E family GTPase
MPVPILLVAGFLGAGKTTLVNHLLTGTHGRRLAAVVNDFGAINIDAELVAGQADGVVALQNGCICCTLQGDLLRTLSLLLRRDPAPEGIVIETSGVSDPAEIIRGLMDPVIWRETPLDTVLCLADARALADQPAMLADPHCLSQLRAGDFIVLNKTDEVNDAEHADVRRRIAAVLPGHAVLDTIQGRIPVELLFSDAEPTVRQVSSAPRFVVPRFESMVWTSDALLSLPRFQAAVGTLSSRLVRAKGILRFTARPETPVLFQLVGRRAAFSPAPPPSPGSMLARLVLIAESGMLDRPGMQRRLAECEEPTLSPLLL